MPAIIEIAPAEEWAVTADEFIDISRFLAENEFNLWKEFEADYPGKPLPKTKILWGSTSYTAFRGFGAACAALAMVAALAQVIQAIRNYTPPATRRKRRTYLCVGACLGIITAAREDVGIMENRALETEDTARRKARKFDSRA